MPKAMTDKKKIDELLTRGVEEIVDKKHLHERLLSGEVLRVKFGIDPTSPHMHLGHTAPLRKLRQFQDLGHQAVLIIGDMTAMIGDPSGRSEARKQLTKEEVAKNQRTYLKQASKILDLPKVEVRHNGEWFFPMSAKELIELSSLVTLQQVLQREDFRKRLADEEHPLSANELMYPLMQAYDSVMVKADLEIGGADQLLNLHMGRRVQRRFDMPEQDLLTVPLIEGTDGIRKMSKSFGNAIALESAPEEMYGQVMTVADAMLVKYFTALTDLPLDEIHDIERDLKKGVNPRDVKAKLAWEIVRSFHSKARADEAAKHFDSLFREHETPADVPTYQISVATSIVDILVGAKLAATRSDARRLIDGGGVKVDGVAIAGNDVQLYPSKKGILVQKGKRHFVRVTS